MSAREKISSRLGTIRAPTAWYASSGNPLEAPAAASTITSWPAFTSASAPTGIIPTRYSSGLISLGTPTRMILSPEAHAGAFPGTAGPKRSVQRPITRGGPSYPRRCFIGATGPKKVARAAYRHHGGEPMQKEDTHRVAEASRALTRRHPHAST